MDNLIACTHPGKLGDALYSLPAIKKLCEKYNVKADFYTSDYCEPLRNLFEYQSYINKFYISPGYKIERMDMGVQPWDMSVYENSYKEVYHLGFRQVPDKAIHQFIAESVGIDEILQVEYECPSRSRIFSKYIVIAPRGETTYKSLFREVAQISPLPIVIIGGNGDNTLGVIGDHISDKTGLDMLETTSIIKDSKGFLGLMSSQLVLANGFDIPKVSPHDGVSWDMRHVVYSTTNYYPVNPTAEEVLDLLGTYYE